MNELKSKVSAIAAVVPLPTGGEKPVGGSDMADAVSALVNLGYRPSDAHSAVARASTAAGGSAPLDDLIKGGLKELAQ